MNINRKGSAKWSGGFKDGRGSISTESGALDKYPYGFASRFEGLPGSNPEELLGAAHAACFTMSLARLLTDANLKAEYLETTARVTLAQESGGYAITAVHLMLTGKVPGADQATFETIAAKAETGCPVSKVLNASITLEANLVP